MYMENEDFIGELFDGETDEPKPDGYDFDERGNYAAFTLRMQNFCSKKVAVQIFDSLGNCSKVPTGLPVELPTDKDNSLYPPEVFETIRPVSEGTFWLALMAMQSGDYGNNLFNSFFVGGNGNGIPELDTDKGIIWTPTTTGTFIHLFNANTNTPALVNIFVNNQTNAKYDHANKQMIVTSGAPFAGRVTWIDTNTNNVTNINILGSYPVGCELSNENAYVTCFTLVSGFITVIDLITKAVIATVVIPNPPARPGLCVFDSVNNRMYTGFQGAVYVIDCNPLSGSYNTIIQTIVVPFNSTPVPSGWSKQGLFYNGKIYFCDGIDSVICIDDLFNVTTIFCGLGVVNIFQANGKIIATSQTTNEAYVINQVANIVTNILTCGAGVLGGVFNTLTNLYFFPNFYGDSISVFDINFNFIKIYGTNGEHPNSYPINYGGKIYTQDYRNWIIEIEPNKNISNALLSAAIFDNFNGDLVFTSATPKDDLGNNISDLCLFYLQNNNRAIPAPIVKARISCAQIPYRQLLGEIEDTVILVKGMQIQVTNINQFFEPLYVRRKTIYGYMIEEEIKPCDFINPIFPNKNVLYITFEKPFFIDKKISIFTKVLPGTEILLTFHSEYFQVNFSFEKYFKLIKNL